MLFKFQALSYYQNFGKLNSSAFLSTMFIEIINNKLYGLLPPGGFVSPSGGFRLVTFV